VLESIADDAPDAYASGQALYALRAAGEGASSDAYWRGVHYLRRAKLEDTTWYMRSRAIGFLSAVLRCRIPTWPRSIHFGRGHRMGRNGVVTCDVERLLHDRWRTALGCALMRGGIGAKWSFGRASATEHSSKRGRRRSPLPLS